MADFICAVHAPDGTPTAFALVEQLPGGSAPTYAVRELRALSGDDATRTLLDVVSSEPQYAGQTEFVTTGGQKAADALRDHGPSAAAVTLLADNAGDADAMDVSAQVLVDTFERLYRDGAVTVPGTLDAASDVIETLYTVADLDAAAPDSDRDDDGDLVADGETDAMSGASYDGDGPDPAVIEQSGSAANVSTEVIEAPITTDEASAAAVDADRRVARIASATGGPAPDLGDHEATALALTLACWYGEATRDDLPITDKADEALANRVNRPTRHN